MSPHGYKLKVGRILATRIEVAFSIRCVEWGSGILQSIGAAEDVIIGDLLRSKLPCRDIEEAWRGDEDRLGRIVQVILRCHMGQQRNRISLPNKF